MALNFQHFDTRLNQWIHTDNDAKNPNSILTETLHNTLLESYFPNTNFSFGHIDEKSTADDLKNHPEGHVLLLSSKTRLLYGPPECLEVIEKLCPDTKDRGAYGSIFLGGCKNSINEQLNILIVDDKTGENGGILSNQVAYKLVGDCYGQISAELYDKLTKRGEQKDNSYRVIQHRFGWKEGDGEDTKYRFGKGTLRPYRLDEIKYAESNNKPKIDLIIPISSFKGTDKDRPGGASKPQIEPGLYQQTIWLGEKSQSEKGKTAISQLLASFPQGIKDFAEELEVQAQRLAEVQDDPRKLAQLYCEKYENRKAFTQEQKVSIEKEIIESSPQLQSFNLNEADDEDELSDENESSQKDDLFMYRLIKADLLGHQQLLETEKVKLELSRFVQNEWRDIAIGRTLTFDRGLIIPSKELKNGEICVPWMKETQKVLNFRSPFLNSNGLCVSINKHVEDRLGPDGESLQGVIVVNDEDHKRIQTRIAQLEAQGIDTDEVDPAETESERQARDYDGDCIGVALASQYPNLTAEAEYKNQPENAYAPTVKLEKQSFYREDGTQPPFEEIALHMSDRMSVGVINNQVTALEALESEIQILQTYGTPEQKSNYLDQVSEHYLNLFEQEIGKNPKQIRAEYRPYMQEFLELASQPRTPEIIEQAMNLNRQTYRFMIEEGCSQNQIAVDLFKSARKPQMNLVRENSRYLYRDVNYIKDKKLSTAYLNSAITPTGHSPVELLINQTNKYFNQSQLESRPIVQFHDLFRGVEFTPQQKFAAIAAKHEFDQKFNAAVRMERQRETQKGPYAIIQTAQGAQLEITNLTRYGHPLIWKAQTINIRLEEIPEKQRSSARPHRLLAIAQIDNEIDKEGKPAYRKLGTVSQQSAVDYNLKPGMATSGAKLVELKPELTRDQTKILFQKAYSAAEEFRASIPEQDRLAAAAAAWSISASRQDELEEARKAGVNIGVINKKVSNFAFAAFPDEIVSRLDELQFTNLRLGTLKNEANQFLGRTWNPEEKHNIEVRATHYPVGHERHTSRLLFVQDTDGEYKEYALIEPRSGMLPIGTKAQANIIGGETSTVKATIEVPGKPPVDVTIRELKKYAYAGTDFHNESVTLGIGNVQVPNNSVLIKLDGKILGELDSDSIRQLESFNKLKNGNLLTLKLTSIFEGGDLAFILGESPNGNLLKINQISQHQFSGQVFHDTDYRQLSLEIPNQTIKDAVYLNGKPLGVLFYKDDKNALKELGLLKTGKLTPARATLNSNFTITVAKVDPTTIEYPQQWTKEFKPEDKLLDTQQQLMIETSAPILEKIKERPTFLFSTLEDKVLGLTGMAVDNHKVSTVTKWLESNNVAFSQVSPDDVKNETRKGLAVFQLVNSSIPPKTLEKMTNKFGAVIESPDEYLQKVNSLPTRPRKLLSFQPSSTTHSPPPLTAPSNQAINSAVPTEPISQENRPTVTIDDLRNWYTAADKLGKPEQYKQRITEVTNEFKATGELSDKALSAMKADTEQHQTLSRLTQIAQKVGAVLGEPGQNGSTTISGQNYDITLNADRKDLAIAHKNGNVILQVQSGKVQINKVTPEVIQHFEQVNIKVDQALSQAKSQAMQL